MLACVKSSSVLVEGEGLPVHILLENNLKHLPYNIHHNHFCSALCAGHESMFLEDEDVSLCKVFLCFGRRGIIYYNIHHNTFCSALCVGSDSLFL